MSTAPTFSRWLSYDTAAAYLGVSRRTLERAVADASTRIPYARDPLTGRVRFRADELDAWWSGGQRRSRR